MAGLSDTWQSFSPKTRQWLTLGGGAAVVGTLALLMATAPDDGQQEAEQRRRLVSNILTDVDPRDLGIDGLGRRLNALEGEVRTIAYNLEKVGLSVADDGKQAKLLETLRREREADLKTLRTEIAALRSDLAVRPTQTAATPDGLFLPPAPSESGTAQGTPRGTALPSPATPPRPPLSDPQALQQIFDPPPAVRSEPANTPEVALKPLSIRRVQQEGLPAEPVEEEIPDVRIPAGSILRGVLLSGMDAPTGRAARQDPYPALLRLKHEAILPNRFQSDVRECFLLVGGYGDLGSERVYLRAESINCIRTDGRTIEVAIDGYAVGEDGKVGVRGRLVNKQGQIIGRAMQVSFLQGFSQLFSTVPVATVSTGGSTVPYQQVFSGEALQGAAIAGTGKALDRLAEYYLDLAETIFPVLEVDAGRGVEVILNRGVGLKLK
ncbi:conjugal transfer protein TrbI [Thiohalocapsa marina]|uniref:Conjugal transfer protein TrbI n=1 Tax=Thiohalocapsa marina TaxID=424902 RepID=A0A5M8FVW4_9GAMM|nr:TrbI/VirB10 family protein [Thiohalocapsa marina]KAA6187925.1 conjugal transfer protein TrbI [Thiohalocapsa marina]